MDLNPEQILANNYVENLVGRLAMSNEPYLDEYLELDMPMAMRPGKTSGRFFQPRSLLNSLSMTGGVHASKQTEATREQHDKCVWSRHSNIK